MMVKISVILCTYNAPDLVRNCLNSILCQDYDNFEVLCIDGMSQDKTCEVIKQYMNKDKRIKLFRNKGMLAEGKGHGKWLGFKKASGDIIAIIDQDNVLQRSDLFRKVAEIINKERDIIGVLGGLTYDKKDSQILRYVSLFGADSFFAYRSLDFIIRIRRQLSKLDSNISPYNLFDIELDNMALTGGNCFFYLKRKVEEIGGYSQDVSIVKNLLQKSNKKIAVVNNATKHYTAKNIYGLAKKSLFGKKSYYEKSIDRFNYFPTTKKERKEFLKNLCFNLLIIPNFYYSAKFCLKFGDAISFIFPFMAFIETISYSINFIRRYLSFAVK